MNRIAIWNRWNEKKCTSKLDAQQEYIELAEKILKRNSVDYSDKNKEKIEKMHKDCNNEEIKYWRDGGFNTRQRANELFCRD